MHRIFKESPSLYCLNCHQQLTQHTKQVHESYCLFKTAPCIICHTSSLISICTFCESKIPQCQFQTHLILCQYRHLSKDRIREEANHRKEKIESRENLRKYTNRRRVDGIESVCPYCKKETNLNEILRHIQVCGIRRGNKVLTENVQKVIGQKKKLSIEKVVEEKQKDGLVEKLQRKLGIKRNTKRNNEEKYPQTELMIPMLSQENKDLNGNRSKEKSVKSSNNIEIELKSKRLAPTTERVVNKDAYQLRFQTPIPVFLKISKQKIELLSNLKAVGVERQNVGKLVKNH